MKIGVSVHSTGSLGWSRCTKEGAMAGRQIILKKWKIDVLNEATSEVIGALYRCRGSHLEVSESGN